MIKDQMKKHGEKTQKVGPSDLTEPEVDAALQLIQLSGDTAESGGGAAKTVEQNSREESVGESSNEISSKVGRRKRFRSIEELYGITTPIMIRSKKKRGKKSIN